MSGLSSNFSTLTAVTAWQRAQRHGPAARAGILAAGGVILAFGCAVLIQDQPLIGLAVPLVFAAAFVCSRYPAAALTAVVLLTGVNGSLAAFAGVPGIAFVDLLVAALWCALLYGWATRGTPRPAWIWPGVAVLCCYLAITALEVLTAETVQLGVEAFRVAAFHLSVVILLAWAGWKLATYERIAHGILLVACVVGGYATVRWVVGPAAAELEAAQQFVGAYNLIGGDVALFGSFSSRLQLAFWIAVVFPFAFGCALSPLGGRWRAVAIAACLSMAIPLLASQGRAALVSIAFGLLLIIFAGSVSRATTLVRLGPTVLAATCTLLLGAIVFNVTVGGSDETEDRYERILNPGSDQSFNGRVLKWELTLEEIERDPFGHGLGTAGIVAQNFRDTVSIASANLESSYLKVAFEQGVLLAALFTLAMIGLLLGLIRRGLTATDPIRAGLALGAAGTLTSTLVMFTSGEYIDDPAAVAAWVIVGLAVGASMAPADRVKSQDTDTDTRTGPEADAEPAELSAARVAPRSP